jgi:hypothetical protein
MIAQSVRRHTDGNKYLSMGDEVENDVGILAISRLLENHRHGRGRIIERVAHRDHPPPSDTLI